MRNAKAENGTVLTLTQNIYLPLQEEKMNVFLEKDTCMRRQVYSKEK